MRISTSWAQQVTANRLMDQSAKVNKLNQQMATGLKLTTASDDPVAAAHIAGLNLNIKQVEQFQKNIGVARERLQQESTVITSSVAVLNQIKDLAIRGANTATGVLGRTQIADQIKLLKDQLLGLANTTDENGGHIFSGFKTDTQPFSEATTTGVYTYSGDGSQRNIQISSNRQIAAGDPGTSVFGTSTGAVPRPGDMTSSSGSIFDAIDKLTADLGTNSPSTGSIGDLQTALDKMSVMQGLIGSRQNSLDDQENTNTDNITSLKGSLGTAQDLDYADAMTQFNMQSTILSAAQQAYSKVQGLSLFNYL